MCAFYSSSLLMCPIGMPIKVLLVCLLVFHLCLLPVCPVLGSAQMNGVDNISKTTIGDILLIGPGINSPNLIFPSRYFFVLHKVPFESIKIRATANTTRKGQHSNNCRLWAQVFTETQFCVHLNVSSQQTHRPLSDLLDAAQFCDDETNNHDDQLTAFKLTIVRYKLHAQNKCNAPLEVIIIADSGRTLHKQPILYGNGSLYSDHCECASSTWSEEMHCASSNANQRLAKQIKEDLRPFQGGVDFNAVLQQSIERFAAHTRSYSFCLYQIIANKLYRNCYGEYVGFARFFDEMLMSLLRKATFPDVEFVANLGDWPLSDKAKPPLPMFSWCGSADSYDLVLPTYELTESILHAQGRISTDIFSTFGKQRLPFEQKQNKLFWRGRDSHRARLDLIKLSQKDPSKFNVSITNFFFFRDEMHDYIDNSTASNATNSKTRYTPFLDFFTHRYQLNIDGTVAAYRFPFLLSGNSLVFKQNSPYYEFFYKLLQNGTHYMPTKSDLSDLTESLAQLIANESPEAKLKTKRIIWQARKFVLSHLLPEHVYCYYFNLISSYAKLLTAPVSLRKHVKLVTFDEDSRPVTTDATECICDKTESLGQLRDEL